MIQRFTGGNEISGQETDIVSCLCQNLAILNPISEIPGPVFSFSVDVGDALTGRPRLLPRVLWARSGLMLERAHVSHTQQRVV